MSLIQLDLNTSVDQIAAYSLIRDVFAAACQLTVSLKLLVLNTCMHSKSIFAKVAGFRVPNWKYCLLHAIDMEFKMQLLTAEIS